MITAEHERVSKSQDNKDWKKWGPYMTERQWGTVREDYSEDGSAWESITHDMARSNAYRWGEEGIAGFCDSKQNLCLAPAFWNHKDSILKERLFGLTGNEGNHGEDVKESYYHLENTPTHSYCRYRYKYPLEAFPYGNLVQENRRRSKSSPEYELEDTGVFNNGFFDVYITYAKNGMDDLLCEIRVINKSNERREISVIPQIWFRNYWNHNPKAKRPEIKLIGDGRIKADCHRIGTYFMYYEEGGRVMFCENETNAERIYGSPSKYPFKKDGINDCIVNGANQAVNSKREGTKAGIQYKRILDAGEEGVVRIRLSETEIEQPFVDFDEAMDARKKECEVYFDEITKETVHPESKSIQISAMQALLWSKQFYYFDVHRWLKGDGSRPERHSKRNANWQHLNNKNILLMPDKWEYPWYAAWDLAFHTVTMARMDGSFAKRQLSLMLREYYMHPNGQIPAYEWNFSDVNPPVHAWACWEVFQIDQKNTGVPDYDFLERIFQKLLMNFTWWVNQKDSEGKNLFEGGFLGLDNIGVFDRSNPPEGIDSIEQADATSWMAMFSLNMLRMSLELANNNPSYQESASKFFRHFLDIAGALNQIGDNGMSLWDEEDEFYYDVANRKNGTTERMKVRSLVGVIPLFAVEVVTHEMYDSLNDFQRRMRALLRFRPDLAQLISRVDEQGTAGKHLFSLMRGHRLEKLLERLLDPDEFLSDFGIRSMSKFHKDNPYEFNSGGQVHRVQYEPAESSNHMFGGNSNWRGPIWFPINYLIVNSLRKFNEYYKDQYTYECPVGSGERKTLDEVANELTKRLGSIFANTDKDSRLFHEFFDGDTGRGVGASHQTGWTALVANLIFEFPEVELGVKKEEAVL